jgi:hypothetical protein
LCRCGLGLLFSALKLLSKTRNHFADKLLETSGGNANESAFDIVPSLEFMLLMVNARVRFISRF